jgi:hypothetical protein
MRELDGEPRSCSRLHQTQCEIWQSTTKCNKSIEIEENNALRISWSCCFQLRIEGLVYREESAEATIWEGEHDKEPSTKWKIP